MTDRNGAGRAGATGTNAPDEERARRNEFRAYFDRRIRLVRAPAGAAATAAAMAANHTPLSPGAPPGLPPGLPPEPSGLLAGLAARLGRWRYSRRASTKM